MIAVGEMVHLEPDMSYIGLFWRRNITFVRPGSLSSCESIQRASLDVCCAVNKASFKYELASGQFISLDKSAITYNPNAWEELLNSSRYLFVLASQILVIKTLDYRL